MDVVYSTRVQEVLQSAHTRRPAWFSLRFAVMLLGLALLASDDLSANSVNSAEMVFQRAAPSVVRIEATTSSGATQGSAVAIRPSHSEETGQRTATLLVTNAHVVKSATQIMGVSDDRRFNISVEYSDPDLDIAFLLAEADWLPIAQVAVASPAVGAEVFAIGSPRGLTNTITSGIISGLRDFSGLPAFQTSAAIAPGSSGGGLFDKSGSLVGVTTARLGSPGEALNFALAIGSIKRVEDAWIASRFVEVAFLELFRNAEGSAAMARSPGFVRWLAAPAQDSARTYILDFQDSLPGLESFDTEAGRSVIAARYSEYQRRLSDLMTGYQKVRVAAAGQQRSESTSSGEQIFLSCRFSSGSNSAAESLSLSFAIDLDRQTLNGKPAEIDDRRVRQQTGTNMLVIDRISGAAAFTDTSRNGPIVAGTCKRITQKAF